MSTTPPRILLKDSVTAGQIRGMAADRWWTLYEEIPRSKQPGLEVIWLSEDEGTAIHYMEDDLLQARYLRVEGRDAEALTAELAREVPHYTEEEVRRAMAARTDVPRSLSQVALSAGSEADPEVLAFFDEAFAHEDPAVRHRAITAAGTLAWRAFRERLERLAEADPDDEVRAYAGRMLGALRRHDWS